MKRPTVVALSVLAASVAVAQPWQGSGGWCSGGEGQGTTGYTTPLKRRL